jgi:hypothetical protein
MARAETGRSLPWAIVEDDRPSGSLSRQRYHELRELLEREIRIAFDEAQARGRPIDRLLLVGTVLGRHLQEEEVRARLELLWTVLDAYVVYLAAASCVDY